MKTRASWLRDEGKARSFMAIKTIPLSHLETDLTKTLNECVESGENTNARSPRRKQVELLDYTKIRAEILSTFPDSNLSPVHEDRLVEVRRQYDGIPEDYLAFLQHVGAGRIDETGLAVYAGPVEPSAIFDAESAARMAG